MMYVLYSIRNLSYKQIIHLKLSKLTKLNKHEKGCDSGNTSSDCHANRRSTTATNSGRFGSLEVTSSTNVVQSSNHCTVNTETLVGAFESFLNGGEVGCSLLSGLQVTGDDISSLSVAIVNSRHN